MINHSEMRVWATRPLAQNQQWQDALQSRGFATVAVPMLAIEPLQDTQSVQSIKNLILDFDQFNKVIFVSQNAVHEAFQWLHDYWPQLPMDIEYFAVGIKTGEQVLLQGVAVTAAQQSMNSEELLALPQMQNVWGEKVLIFRGQGGLPRLGEVLHERGAIVRYCELYQRLLPADAQQTCQNLLPTVTANDVIPLFSGETLQNFSNLLQACNSAERAMTVVVPGKRVAQMAQSLGFSQVAVASNASSQAMLEAVLSHAAQANH